jgi:hypothetical protein
MGVDETGISGKHGFPVTSWSMIRSARDPASPEYARHPRRLIELYWRPVYSVVRSAFRVPPDDAKDLTLVFFSNEHGTWHDDPHHSFDMPVILAGRANGRVKTGLQVRYQSGKTPTATSS